jgi:hypothetical protein
MEVPETFGQGRESNKAEAVVLNMVQGMEKKCYVVV